MVDTTNEIKELEALDETETLETAGTYICEFCGGLHNPALTTCCCDAPQNDHKICTACGEHN